MCLNVVFWPMYKWYQNDNVHHYAIIVQPFIMININLDIVTRSEYLVKAIISNFALCFHNSLLRSVFGEIENILLVNSPKKKKKCKLKVLIKSTSLRCF